MSFDGLPVKFFLIAALYDVGEKEDADDEVEGGFAHGFDGIAEEFEVSEVSAFGEEHDAYDAEDEEAKDLIHAVFL